MKFEWDEAKNLKNIDKHQIDFVDVPEMFESPMLASLDDRFDYGEDRWIGIGSLRNGVAVIVWTERKGNVIRQAEMSAEDSINTSQTNWAAIEAMTDDEIDYSDIPPLTEDFFEKATLQVPATKIHGLSAWEIEIRELKSAIKNLELKSAAKRLELEAIKENHRHKEAMDRQRLVIAGLATTFVVVTSSFIYSSKTGDTSISEKILDALLGSVAGGGAAAFVLAKKK